jgi:hypothetical protein
MKRDPEPATNQFGHPASGPEISGKPLGGRLLRQPCSNLLVLLGSQKARPTRHGLRPEARIAFSAMTGHPLGNGDAVNTQTLCDSDLRLPLQDGSNCTQPYGFHSEADPLLLMN